MKNLLNFAVAAFLLLGTSNLFAQANLELAPNEGGSATTNVCFHTSNITKNVGGAFILHFETVHESTAPMNLTLSKSGDTRSIYSSNVLSFTDLGNHYKLVIEVEIYRENPEPCPPSELCKAFLLDRYTVTVYTCGEMNYTLEEDVPWVSPF